MATSTNPSRKRQVAKIPSAAPKPQDHLPAKNDARPEMIQVDYEGESYTIETEVLDDVEILERLDRSTYNPVGALRMMLGLEQWDRFKSSTMKRTGTSKVTVSETQTFLEAVLEAVQAGNS